MTFVDFLREKDFVRPLDPRQVARAPLADAVDHVLELRRDARPEQGHGLRLPPHAADDDRLLSRWGRLSSSCATRRHGPPSIPQDLAPVLSLLRDGWQPDGEHEPVEGGLGQVVAILRRISPEMAELKLGPTALIVIRHSSFVFVQSYGPSPSRRTAPPGAMTTVATKGGRICGSSSNWNGPPTNRTSTSCTRWEPSGCVTDRVAGSREKLRNTRAVVVRRASATH